METRSRDEILAEMQAAEVPLPEELKQEVIALADKMSLLLKDYSPNAVLFVLEAALVQNIDNLSPALGDLFQSMLQVYKQKANMLLTLTDLLMSVKEKDPVE